MRWPWSKKPRPAPRIVRVEQMDKFNHWRVWFRDGDGEEERSVIIVTVPSSCAYFNR